MKSYKNKRVYSTPDLSLIPLDVEDQFLASQLDDYDDNPIFSDPAPEEDYY